MLKFSANLSLLFNELEWIDRFAAAKKYGFKAVEIQFPYHLSATTLADVLTDNRLKLVLFNVDADDLLQGGEGLACVPEKRGRFREAVEQALRYAEVLQPEAVNVLPGCCLKPERLTSYLDTFYDNVTYAAEQFSALGIKTVFEAINRYDMPGFIVANGSQMLDTLAHLQHSNLFMQCDVYHLQRMGDVPHDFIRQHSERIGHIQFADCPGRNQPGTGQIDFAAVFTTIQQSSYEGWTGAEYKPVGTTPASLAWLDNWR